MKLNNSALQELYDTLTTGTFVFTPSGTDPIYEAFRECDNKLSESATFAHIKDLEDSNDILEGSNKALLEANFNLCTEKNNLKNRVEQLEKDLDDAKKQLNYFTHSRDDWRDRAKHAEKELEDLKKDKERLEGSRLVWALKANERGKKLNEVEQKIEELASQYQDLSIKLKRCQINVGRESRFLWDMLQEVSDYYYFGGDDEFDTDDCEMTSMTDIIDNLNVDQFLEAYKNWHKAQEQHRLDHMRDWLADFCSGRFCDGCPLESSEYKCGYGYSFKGVRPIPDEWIKRYYEKARGCGKCAWECTLEAKVEIDQDLLKKVCGIDSDD